MDRRQRIISLLTKEFQPSLLELRDNSAAHAGHAGARPEGETHFDLVIVSEKFAGMSRVERHRAIHRMLDAELQSGLHALSIKASSPGD